MALKTYKYKYGDIVKVVRKVYDQSDWNEDMDEHVGDGNLYMVISRFGNSKKVRLNTRPNEWMFDTKALELIQEGEPLPILTPVRSASAVPIGTTISFTNSSMRWNGERWV